MVSIPPVLGGTTNLPGKLSDPIDLTRMDDEPPGDYGAFNFDAEGFGASHIGELFDVRESLMNIYLL